MKINLSFDSTIEFAESEEEETLPLTVSGMSCKAGYIKNKDFIIPFAETANIVKTLKKGIDGHGAYLLKDHGGGGFFSSPSVDSLVGRVSNAHDENGLVFYEARLEDVDLAYKVRKKLVTSSSVGLRVNKMECSICGREYGHMECNHFLGKQYPDEKLTELAQPFLADMGGIPVGAIVGRDIQAREQSIVLFPAIPGASVGFNFSEDAQNFFNETEKKKALSVEEIEDKAPILDAETIEKALNSVDTTDTFNRHNTNSIDVKTMTEQFDFESLTGEIASLKQANIDLASEVEGLKTVKDPQVATLAQNVTDLSSELETAKAIIQKFTDAETMRYTKELNAKKAELKELRETLELPEKVYDEVSEDVLDSELSLLKSFTKKEVKGLAADGTDPVTDEIKMAEAKEDVRELIFKRRTDDKKIKGIKSVKQLVM